MRVWVNLEHPLGGSKYGSGPVARILRARLRDRLDRIGEFEFETPADAPNAGEIEERRVAALYAVINGAVTYLGGGPVDQITTRLRDDGTATLIVKGGDLLRELTRRSTGALELNNASGDVNEGALLELVTDQSWTYTRLASVNTPPFKGRYVYEPLYGAILRTLEHVGGHMRRGVNGSTGSPRHLEVIRDAVNANPILATMHGDPQAVAANPYACIVTDIEIVSESYDLKTRAYVWGAGEGEDRLTLGPATLWPDGTTAATASYVLDGVTYNTSLANNYVRNSTLEGTTERDDAILSFKDITPLTNSSVDLVNGANYLLLAAVNYLHQRRQPYKSYRLRVAGLTATVQPGDTIRVQARKVRDGQKTIDIDEELYVLEVERLVDGLGIYTASLVVANHLRWGESDGEYTARQLNSSDIMQAHPQMGPVLDTVTYEGAVDDTYDYVCWHWAKNSVTTVGAVYFRFRADPLRAPVKAVNNAAVTSGPSSATSSGSSSETTTGLAGAAVNHAHALEVTMYNGFTAGYPLYFDSTAGLNMDNGLSGTATGGVTTLVEPDHDHNMEHAHNIPHTHGVTSNVALTYGLYDDPGTPYSAEEMEIQVNSDAKTAITSAHAVSGAPGWYEVDITSRMVDANGRPNQEVNWVIIGVRDLEKDGRTGARITAQIERRLTIQSVALT